MPEAKPRDTNIPRVLSPLDNSLLILLVPEAKPRDANNISFYHFYVANIPHHCLMISNTYRRIVYDQTSWHLFFAVVLTHLLFLYASNTSSSNSSF